MPDELSAAEYKKSGRKFTLGFVGLFLFVFTTIVSWKAFQLYVGQQAVERLAQKMAQEEQEIIEKRKADIFGGKTPQETLNLYIKAVEKGDYELASKYLVIEKQENEIQQLNALKEKNNLVSFIALMKQASMDGDIESNEARMKSKTETSYYFINFYKYPNGIWKIVEI